jgi:hypothetical protein
METEQRGAEPLEAGHDSAEHDSAEHDSAEQESAESTDAEHDSAESAVAEQDSGESTDAEFTDAEPADAGEADAGEASAEPAADLRVVMLMDPGWQPSDDEQPVPPEAVVGGWYIDENGDTERFVANPEYRPSQPGSPTDPVDAALQLVVRGDADGSDLLLVMGDALFGVAVDAEGLAVVAPAPDEMPSLLVTTAPAHRARCDVAGWVEVSAADLAEALPDEGVDVLLNPGAPTSIRIEASAIKGSLGLSGSR